MALTLLESKKGIAFVWLGILIIIFAMGLWYIILSQPWQTVSEITASNFTGTPYEETYNKIHFVWDNFLIIFIFMMMALGVLIAMRKNNYEY